MGGCVNSKIDDRYVLQYIDEKVGRKDSLQQPQNQQQSKKKTTNGEIKGKGKNIRKDKPNVKGSGQETEQMSGKLEVRKLSTSPGGKVDVSSKTPWIIKASSFSQKLSASNVDCVKVIGSGLMGIVRIAKVKNTNFHFALKCLSKVDIEKHNDHNHIEHERTLLSKMNSPFCVSLLGTFQDPDCLFLALELCIGGELFRRLSRGKTFSCEAARFYTIEIFAALEHVHELGYVYRDLKPENVMLDEEGHCKLVDFGFATIPDSQGVMKTNCGTPAYLAPEQLNSKFTNGYTKIVDWWSLGCILYELLAGNTPFCKSNKDTNHEIYLRVLNGSISYPSFIDSKSKDLISRLCHADVNKRLTEPQEIRKLEYFNVDWNAVLKRKLVPPFIPRLEVSGDSRYFDQFKELNPYSITALPDKYQSRYANF
jgi:serine/threonine protein kinase